MIDLSKVDSSLLDRQRMTLLELIPDIEDKAIRDDLDGILNLLDYIADELLEG